MPDPAGAPPPIIYLHGFASSPGSYKAQRFVEVARARGLQVELPDLNEGDFTGLTVSRQLALVGRVAEELGPGPLLLMGSSMGAYIAALFGAREPRVSALVLMAPAFGFLARWADNLGQARLDRWRDEGTMEVMHFATDRMTPLGWQMMADGPRHPARPELTAPTLILHGRGDEVVPVQGSVDYAASRPNVTLELLDSDHGLGDVTGQVIQRSLGFLEPWIGRGDDADAT